MSKPKIKVKVKQKKGKNMMTKFKAKMVGSPYIGNETLRQKMRADSEKARADSLQRELDSIKCQLKITIKEQ